MNQTLRAARAVLLALAALVLILTRIPHHQTLWAVAAALLGLTVLGLGLTWMYGPHKPWMRATTLAGGAVLLLLPTSHEAILAVPATVAALLALLAAYHLHDARKTRAPTLETGNAGPQTWARFIPLALVVAAVTLATLLTRSLLPDRWSSLYELRAATEPLVTLALVAGVILTVVWLREGLARRPEQKKEADA